MDKRSRKRQIRTTTATNFYGSKIKRNGSMKQDDKHRSGDRDDRKRQVRFVERDPAEGK